MKNPNGYGSVVRLSGNRRRPFQVRTGATFDERGYPVYQTIGYAKTRAEGNMMLAEYNRDPYNIDTQHITMQELFDLMIAEKSARMSESLVKTLRVSMRYCENLKDIEYKKIKTHQMQSAVDNCDKGASTQHQIKNLFCNLDKMANEIDLQSNRYSDLVKCDPAPETSRQPFSDDEIAALYALKSDQNTDIIKILLHTGWRANELLNLRKSDIDLKEWTMTGGLKTKAGKNRIVPVHPDIQPIISQLIQSDGDRLINATYKQMLAGFKAVMREIGTTHTPHECRHTFFTRLSAAGADRKCIDMMMGHSSGNVGDDVYNHRSVDDLRKAIMLLDYKRR